MKKFLVFILILFFSTSSCFASPKREANKTYKQINKLYKKQDFDVLKTYVSTNEYAPNAIFKNSKFLLSTCIEKGYDLKFLKILFDNGANPNIRFEYNRTPLMKAAYYHGNPDIIRYLITLYPDVNDVNSHGNTPLLTLCSNYPNSSAIYDLINAGADLFKLNYIGDCAYSVLPTNYKKTIQDYYNNKMSNDLTKKYQGKKNIDIINLYGLPKQKITINNNTEVWEYSSKIEKHIPLKSVTTTSSNYHTNYYGDKNQYSNTSGYSSSNTTYYGDYTVIVEETNIFHFNKNQVSYVKFFSNYSTHK